MPTKRTNHRPLANVPRDPENPDQTFTVKPPDRGAVAEASYGEAAESNDRRLTPEEIAARVPLADPYVDLPYQRSHRQLIDETANIVRHTEAARTVALVSDKSSRYGEKHVRALELYASARNDLRDLKIAEHDVVRQRDEAVAKCCERMVNKVPNEADGRAPKRDNTPYLHSTTSATAWAYEHDGEVKDLQRQREELTVSLFHAEAAVDIAERAVKASGLLLARDTSSLQAQAMMSLAAAFNANRAGIVGAIDRVAANLVRE